MMAVPSEARDSSTHGIETLVHSSYFFIHSAAMANANGIPSEA